MWSNVVAKVWERGQMASHWPMEQIGALTTNGADQQEKPVLGRGLRQATMAARDSQLGPRRVFTLPPKGFQLALKISTGCFGWPGNIWLCNDAICWSLLGQALSWAVLSTVHYYLPNPTLTNPQQLKHYTSPVTLKSYHAINGAWTIWRGVKVHLGAKRDWVIVVERGASRTFYQIKLRLPFLSATDLGVFTFRSSSHLSHFPSLSPTACWKQRGSNLWNPELFLSCLV